MAKETKKTTAKKTVKKTAAKKATVQKNDLLKNAISYIPFVGIVLFFVEKDKSPELMKHIKYGTILLVAYIVLTALLNSALSSILAFIYLVSIVFLGYKAYTGEPVELQFIDKIEGEVKGKLK